jgi:murein DD-endopeptidase MepM/ murein hydrolase activator NlpD
VTESPAATRSARRSRRHLALRRRALRKHFHFYSKYAAWTFAKLPPKSPISWRREHWILASVAVAVAVLAGLVMPTWAGAVRADDAPLSTVELALPALAADRPDAGDEALAGLASAGMLPGQGEGDAGWRVVTVRAGQSLADIFHAEGFSPAELQRVLDSKQDQDSFRRLHPGDEFGFKAGPDGRLAGLRFDRDEGTRVVLSLDADGVRARQIARALEKRTHVARGVVESSLFDAGAQAGMSDAMILKLATAFGYDIDFAQDLRVGDSFSVIYEDVYREGERLRDGDIVAATFINDGKRYTAFRYIDAEGNTLYYSEDGRPLRKSFLRTPVDFTRITSRFTAGRMHPILGTMRAHKGVDYGAPMGTPIYAAGDGKVQFRGQQPGYGNVVILQHSNNVTTLYGHMSRFAGIVNGQRVRQGQLIGYVGMTGLATGPHLHYEFRVGGVHRDPLTVTLPKPEPLPAGELARFREQTQPMLARLKLLEGPRQLARAN